MLATMRAAAPRIGSPTGVAAAGVGGAGSPGAGAASAARCGAAGAGGATARRGRHRLRGGVAPVVGEEVLPALAHRRRVGEVLLVHLVDEPRVRARGRSGAARRGTSGSSATAPIVPARASTTAPARGGRPVRPPSRRRRGGSRWAQRKPRRAATRDLAGTTSARSSVARVAADTDSEARRGHAALVHRPVGVDRDRRRRPRGGPPPPRRDPAPLAGRCRCGAARDGR